MLILPLSFLSLPFTLHRSFFFVSFLSIVTAPLHHFSFFALLSYHVFVCFFFRITRPSNLSLSAPLPFLILLNYFISTSNRCISLCLFVSRLLLLASHTDFSFSSILFGCSKSFLNHRTFLHISFPTPSILSFRFYPTTLVLFCLLPPPRIRSIQFLTFFFFDHFFRVTSLASLTPTPCHFRSSYSLTPFYLQLAMGIRTSASESVSPRYIQDFPSIQRLENSSRLCSDSKYIFQRC